MILQLFDSRYQMGCEHQLKPVPKHRFRNYACFVKENNCKTLVKRRW